MLNLQAIKSLVTVYGAPLFDKLPTIEAGSVQAGEYTIVDNTLAVTTAEGVMYIPIRTARKDAGVDETQTFNIGVFTALRDASGTYNGEAWTITAGEQKVYAY
jgi:hypothetical protein